MTKVSISTDEDDLIDGAWDPKPTQRSNRRTQRPPERQARRDERVTLGRQIELMRTIPPKPVSEAKPPKQGKLLKRAMSDEVKATRIPPLCRRLLCLLAAYADGGQQSPPIKSLAARMSVPMPEAMWLLRQLEIEGWIAVEWTADYDTPNKYTITWRDGE